MESFYKIRVAFGKISFELESHDKEWLESKEKALMGNLLSNPDALLRLSKLEEEGMAKGATSLVEIGGAALTINEYYQKFIKGKNWTRPKIALFLLYYIEKVRGESEISSSDVRRAFKDISYPKYDTINYTDMLNQQKRKGFLNKIEGKWKLTVTGIDYVMSELQSE